MVDASSIILASGAGSLAPGAETVPGANIIVALVWICAAFANLILTSALHPNFYSLSGIFFWFILVAALITSTILSEGLTILIFLIGLVLLIMGYHLDSTTVQASLSVPVIGMFKYALNLSASVQSFIPLQ